MTPTDELIQLARILADWVSPAPSITIYLFGSRVRGDHRPDSDVDVLIDISRASTTEDATWWSNVNADEFRTIDTLLPGPLQILESHSSLRPAIISAPVVHRDRQVVCVWRDAKPL